MGTRLEVSTGPSSDSSRRAPRPVNHRAATSRSYAGLAGIAAVTSIGIWLLMIVDEDLSIGAASVQMVVKFTNLSTGVVALVAGWIASGRAVGTSRAVAHLTAILMSVVTCAVNALLLDPTLPGGWWGVVDLFQHDVIPIAVVGLWAVVGPRVDVRGGRIHLALLTPLVWLAVVLVRGALTGEYPYDFVDVDEAGSAGVATVVGGILLAMLLLATAVTAVDRHRLDRRR